MNKGYAISYAGSLEKGYQPRLAVPGCDRWHNFRDADGKISLATYATPAEAIARAADELVRILNAGLGARQVSKENAAAIAEIQAERVA